MKKMYIGIILIVAIYLITGVISWLRGPLVMGVRLTSIYPYRLSPITWIKEYKPNGKTGDGAMKLGYSLQGKYKVNILSGSWEKIKTDKIVSITGKAQNVKQGAELLTTDKGPVLIEGLSAWPNEVLGKSITANGKELLYKETVPASTTDENGLISQGSETAIKQWVLVEAKWEY